MQAMPTGGSDAQQKGADGKGPLVSKTDAQLFLD